MDNYKRLGINKHELEDRLNTMEENSKKKLEEKRERELYEKAIKNDKDNMAYLHRTFPYITEEHLLETIKGLYPAINEIFLIDLDQRDINKVPLVKFKNFRPLTVYHRRRYNVRDCEASVQFKMVLAVIENGQVYIKSAQFKNGIWNR